MRFVIIKCRRGGPSVFSAAAAGRTAAGDEYPAAGEAAGVAALAEHERVRRRDIGPRPARCGGGSQGQAARGAEHVCPTLWSSDSNGLKRVRHAPAADPGTCVIFKEFLAVLYGIR